MCSALVCPHGLKERRMLMRMALRTTFVSCVALVLPRGFKNDEFYMRIALRTTYISCVARLFGLMAVRYFLCLSPTDFRWVRWTPARTNCLHRIRSSLFANIQPPRCKSCTYWSYALRSFPVPVAIGLNPPASEDDRTQVGCIGHVCLKEFSLVQMPQKSNIVR